MRFRSSPPNRNAHFSRTDKPVPQEWRSLQCQSKLFRLRTWLKFAGLCRPKRGIEFLSIARVKSAALLLCSPKPRSQPRLGKIVEGRTLLHISGEFIYAAVEYRRRLRCRMHARIRAG